MRRIDPLDPDTAPERSRDLLRPIIERHGAVGDMVRTMAHSPALLQGYLDLSRAMKRTRLPRALSEKLSLALQEWIGCQTCLAAHIEAGRAAGLSETDITLARQGSSTEPRENSLIGFGLRVLTEPATITDADIAQLRQDGWNDRIIAEVVGLAALNLLTGAFNLVAGNQPTTTQQ